MMNLSSLLRRLGERGPGVESFWVDTKNNALAHTYLFNVKFSRVGYAREHSKVLTQLLLIMKTTLIDLIELS